MSEQETIKILIKEPYKEAYVKEVEHTLKNMQKIVGGMLDCIGMPGVDDIDIFFDDEGLLKSSAGSVWIAGSGDCIKGTCYFVGYDEDTGESISLTDKQIKQCQKYVKTFELKQGEDLYLNYYTLVPKMYEKSEKYLNKSLAEM